MINMWLKDNGKDPGEALAGSSVADREDYEALKAKVKAARARRLSQGG